VELKRAKQEQTGEFPMKSTISKLNACVLFLVNESEHMSGPIAGGTKPKLEVAATALNSLLRKLDATQSCDIAIVGYRQDEQGTVDIGCRWGGSLEGSEFVPLSTIAESPLRVEQRTRWIPDSDGTVFNETHCMMGREETVEFPVWYAPQLGQEQTPDVKAFQYCSELVSRWLTEKGAAAQAPMIIHITTAKAFSEDVCAAVDQILNLQIPTGAALVYHVHLGSISTVPATLYPSNRQYLPSGPIRTLFNICSVLPTVLAQAIREEGVTILPKARGLIYNAQMGDLVRFFALARAHLTSTSENSAATAVESCVAVSVPEDGYPSSDEGAVLSEKSEDANSIEYESQVSSSVAGVSESVVTSAGTAATEDRPQAVTPPVGGKAEPGLLIPVVFLVDQSTKDPTSDTAAKVCSALQENVNSLLKEISQKGNGQLQTALIIYGVGGSVETEIVTPFESATGHAFVNDSALLDVAIRVDEVETQIPDGTGGLISVSDKNPIFVELQPTAPADIAHAFREACQFLTRWYEEHPTATHPPVLFHSTRGEFDAADIAQAAAQIEQLQPGPLIYHLIVTETPSRSVAYPDNDDPLETESLKHLWRISAPLLGREKLATSKPAVSELSRGFVVNGRFDLLFDGLLRTADS